MASRTCSEFQTITDGQASPCIMMKSSCIFTITETISRPDFLPSYLGHGDDADQVHGAMESKLRKSCTCTESIVFDELH